MVSFQCHVCGDVVKKPKLDQHRSRCHGGFDCIDCSTTFNTPADYKGHTQCISEAEKYQKSMYKGVKTPAPAPRNNYPPLPANSAPPPRQFGGRGGYGGGGGWGRPRTTATGANDTPLGTPARNSPVPSPAAKITPIPNAPVVQGILKPPTKIPEPPAPSTSSEKKKDKKRKSSSVEDDLAQNTPTDGEPSSKKAKIAKGTEAVDPASIPLPPSPKQDDERRKEKKSRKDKKEKKGELREEGGEKEKKKKRKEERLSGDDVKMSAPTDEQVKKEKRSKKEKKEKKLVDEQQAGDEVDPTENSKKRKRDRVVVKETEGEDLGEAREKKIKKHIGDAMEVDEPPNGTDQAESGKVRKDKKEKKEKKSKRSSSVAAQ